MTTTHAIVIPTPGRVELRDVALSAPGPDDVVVRTAYTSISAGTERMLLAGQLPHPQLSFPVVPGYETVGRVVDAGANVPAEMQGQCVFLGGARCFRDVNPAWGGQARTLIADHRRIVPLHGVDPQEGVLLALAATALHGIDLLEVSAGQRVLVLGQGPVGQIAARIAGARGATVTVTDRVASRLRRAAADHVVHAGAPPEALGGPFDAIIEATGSMTALAPKLMGLADGGKVLLLGYYQTLELPYMPLFLRQARLLTAREWATGDLARCRDMLRSGELDVSTLLTHRMPVEQVGDAYAIALDDPDCLKLVLDWTDLG
jgi:bacteriochlorophyllide a dehydrogenase